MIWPKIGGGQNRIIARIGDFVGLQMGVADSS